MIVHVVSSKDDLFLGAKVLLNDGREAEIVDDDEDLEDLVIVLIEDELEPILMPVGRPLFMDDTTYISELLSVPEHRPFDSDDESVFAVESDIFDEVFG